MPCTYHHPLINDYGYYNLGAIMRAAHAAARLGGGDARLPYRARLGRALQALWQQARQNRDVWRMVAAREAPLWTWAQTVSDASQALRDLEDIKSLATYRSDWKGLTEDANLRIRILREVQHVA